MAQCELGPRRVEPAGCIRRIELGRLAKAHQRLVVTLIAEKKLASGIHYVGPPRCRGDGAVELRQRFGILASGKLYLRQSQVRLGQVGIRMDQFTEDGARLDGIAGTVQNAGQCEANAGIRVECQRLAQGGFRGFQIVAHDLNAREQRQGARVFRVDDQRLPEQRAGAGGVVSGKEISRGEAQRLRVARLAQQHPVHFLLRSLFAPA